MTSSIQVSDELEQLMQALVDAGRQECFADNTGSSAGQAVKHTEQCKDSLRAAITAIGSQSNA